MSKPDKKHIVFLDEAKSEGIIDFKTDKVKLRGMLIATFGIGHGEAKSTVAYWLDHYGEIERKKLHGAPVMEDEPVASIPNPFDG